MGREVRMVPVDWEHPKDNNGEYIPLLDNYLGAIESFEKAIREMGLNEALDYYGGGPISENYMLEGPRSKCTHYQMYECVSEGTPVSPPRKTQEKLAQWLVDNKVTVIDNIPTYNQWLATIKAGPAPSMIIRDGKIMSGVEASE